MDTHETLCTLRTQYTCGFLDITDDVKDAVRASGVLAGRVTVFSPSDRCPLVANERESGLLRDIKRAIIRLKDSSGHGAPDSIGTSSLVLPIVNGDLRLGMWQRVLLFELDEPSERQVSIQVVGE
ncbi:MAG: YjbQ family protein [Actinomycetota bacterium]